MSKVSKLLDLACNISRLKDDDRNYFLGSIGIRRDGIYVMSQNGAPKYPTPEHHCETRLLRKLGKYGTIYLARSLADGTWGNAKPCFCCQIAMKSKKVVRCYYTCGPKEWSCLEF